MRKLLVVLLALVVGVFLYAENVTVSWSGSADFTLTIDENGVDVDGSASIDITWAPLSEELTNGKVTVSFSFDVGDSSAGFSSLAFDGSLVKIKYVSGVASLGKLFTGKDNDGDGDADGIGKDYASFALKPVSMLTLYYVDLLDETTTNAGSPAEKSYFDDFVAAEVSKDLGIVSLDVLAAFYDTDATPASNSYEYAGEVSVTGAELLKGLSVWVGFGNSVASGTVYGVKASYDYSLDISPVTVEVAPSVKYTEGLSTLAYAYFTDKKLISAVVSVGVDVKPVSVSVEVDPAYDLTKESSALSVPFTAKAKLDVTSDISASAAFEVDDLMNFAGGWDVKGNVTASISPVSVEANVLYNNDNELGYNASVSYTIEEGLKARVFYGTLYDADGDDSDDINTDAQWYVQLGFSTSF